MAGGGAQGILYGVDADGAHLHALTPEDGSSKFPALWN
jgi:hypothetical protein